MSCGDNGVNVVEVGVLFAWRLHLRLPFCSTLGEHGGLRGQQGDTPTAHSQTNLGLHPRARWSRLQPWLLTSELKLHSQHFMVVISSNLNLCSVFWGLVKAGWTLNLVSALLGSRTSFITSQILKLLQVFFKKYVIRM